MGEGVIGDSITVFTVVVMACCGRALGKVEMTRVEEERCERSSHSPERGERMAIC